MIIYVLIKLKGPLYGKITMIETVNSSLQGAFNVPQKIILTLLLLCINLVLVFYTNLIESFLCITLHPGCWGCRLCCHLVSKHLVYFKTNIYRYKSI